MDRLARRHTHTATVPRSVDVHEFDEWEAFAPYPDHVVHAAQEASAELSDSYPPFGRREEFAHASPGTEARHDLHDTIKSLMGDDPALTKAAALASPGPAIRCPRCLSSRIDTRNRAHKAAQSAALLG
ncbi:hypothetical protein [Burkholderia sp. Bp9143]|uniref:hypothetical protein n=1 Tax=Burkholderia sp. Bp9143 TaxID=2184574 RepID=UPI0021AB3F30|nr:hypothetical protein [Burkholderia sp. Bp9143]